MFLSRSPASRIQKGQGSSNYFQSISVRRHFHPTFDSFELIDCSLFCRPSVIRFLVVYRPPASSQSVFRDEFESLLEKIALSNEKLLIVGDFNLGIRDKPDEAAKRLLNSTEAFGLSQLVTSATNDGGSILDLDFARSSDDLVRSTSVLGYFSDHRPVLVSLSCRAPRFPFMAIYFRHLRRINAESFARDFERLDFITGPSDALSCLVSQYNDGLLSLIDRHALVVTKNVVLRPAEPWKTDATRQTKREMRHAERIRMKRKLTVHLELYRDKRRQHNYRLASERTCYVSTKVADCCSDSRKLFSLVNSLMGTQTTRSVPKRDSDAAAATELANFFDNVSGIRSSLDSADDAGLPPIQPQIPFPIAESSLRLVDFRQLTTDDVRKLISSSPNKSCCLALKRFIDFFVFPKTAIINLSLSHLELSSVL